MARAIIKLPRYSIWVPWKYIYCAGYKLYALEISIKSNKPFYIKEIFYYKYYIAHRHLLPDYLILSILRPSASCASDYVSSMQIWTWTLPCISCMCLCNQGESHNDLTRDLSFGTFSHNSDKRMNHQQWQTIFLLPHQVFCLKLISLKFCYSFLWKISYVPCDDVGTMLFLWSFSYHRVYK